MTIQQNQSNLTWEKSAGDVLEPFSPEERVAIIARLSQRYVDELTPIIHIRRIDDRRNLLIAQPRQNEVLFKIELGEPNDPKSSAELVFTLQEKTILMTHRDMVSVPTGISGSTLLRKAEEYFSLVKEAGLLYDPEGNAIETYLVESGQLGVIRWALKNGYSFRHDQDEEVFDSIVRGTNDSMIVQSFTEGAHDQLFKDYIFDKRAYWKKRSDPATHVDPKSFGRLHSKKFALEKKVM